MRESKFQRRLITDLHDMFPGCLILKNDSAYLQGIPDIIILYKDRWAMLEIKAALDSPRQPNQDYYVDLADGMSFAAFICPENEGDVLHALQSALQPRRSARVPIRQ